MRAGVRKYWRRERKAFLVGLLARRNYKQSGIQEASLIKIFLMITTSQ